MCRLFLVLALLVFTRGVSLGGVRVLSSEREELTVEMTLPNLDIEIIEREGQVFHLISFEKAGFMSHIGLPQLPLMGTLVAIPSGAEVKVEVLEKDSYELFGYKILPFQAEKDAETDFVIDREFYQTNTQWPQKLFEISDSKVWRDLDLVELRIFPVQYNPAEGKLTVYSRIVLRISFVGGSWEKKSISSRYARMYRSLVLNYEYLGYQEKDIAGRYLIIAADTFLTEIQPLRDWYWRKGYSCQTVAVSSIGSTPEEIKSYLFNEYQNDGLDWALLVGNIYQIPLYNSGAEDYSDSWYSMLVGDDLYAEIAIGRLSMREEMLLADIVQKILDYEMNPPRNEWLEKSLLVAHGEAYPYKYSQCKREIFNYEYSFFKPTMDTLMGGVGATNADVTAAINQGRNVVNYRGHGGNKEWWEWGASGSWTNDNVDSLTNRRKTPIVYNIACSCHGLGCQGICIGEAWLGKYPGGAVASLGGTRPTYTYANHDYDKSLYWAPFDDQVFEIGWMSNYAAAYILPIHDWCGEWNTMVYLWLGDPAMELWTGIPDTMSVEHPEKIYSDQDFIVRVRYAGKPMPGALVCLVKNGEVYEAGYTNPSGQIVFNVHFVEPDTTHLTVTAHDFLPFEADIFGDTGIEESHKRFTKLVLLQNRPNPFMGLTMIKYLLPSDGFARLRVFDAAGRLVKILVAEFQKAGAYEIRWQTGELSEGIYFYRLDFRGKSITQKMILLK